MNYNPPYDPTENSILVTKNFGQAVDDAFGTITFDVESEAYKQLLKNPDKYCFVLGYVERDDPNEPPFLYELSMINKKGIK